MESVFTVEYSDASGASSSVEVAASSRYAAKRVVKRSRPGAVIKRVCGGSSDSPSTPSSPSAESCHDDEHV